MKPLQPARLSAGVVLTIWTLLLSPATVAAQSLSHVGVVLMHGKQQQAGSGFAGLARDLKAAGASVTMPEMPWSGSRIYSNSYDEVIQQIADAVQALKASGKTKIFIGGTSIGANAAIGYAARKEGIDGVIAVAPGHFPERGKFREETGASVLRAKELAAKRQEQPQKFDDYNQGASFKVTATPAVYLSFLSPDGPANFQRNARTMRRVPLFMAVGTRDQVFGWARNDLFKPAAKHPASRYLEVNAGHGDTGEAAKGEIVKWLLQL